MDVRSNYDKTLSVIRELKNDADRSNDVIARQCGTAEFVVRRYRSILEATSIIAPSDTRIGRDGRTYTLPTVASV
jgi:hypothetical protein